MLDRKIKLRHTFDNHVILASLITVAVGIGIMSAINPVVAALPIAALLVLVAVTLFTKPHWALYLFVLCLPIHSLIITLLLSQTGLPNSAVRLVAAWKEILLLIVVLTVVGKCVQPRVQLRLVSVDGWTITWLVLILFYFVGHHAIIGSDVPLSARLYGARGWLLFVLPYIAGRLLIPPEQGAARTLRLIVFVGVVTSVIGIIEVLFIPTQWHIQLGVPHYFGNFLNLSYPTYLGGLPPNYWAELGGRIVRRSVSTYLSGQGFALPFLVVWPVVIYYYIAKLTRHSGTIVLVCGVALLLTITRMTILVCAIQGLVLFAMFGRRRLIIRLFQRGVMIFCLLLLVSPSLRSFVANTVTLSDTSAMARPQQWMDGVRSLIDTPFGNGLGASGQVGARFGAGGAGSEAGYFKVSGDLGAAGLVVFFGWFLSIIAYAGAGYRTLTEDWQGIAAITLVIAIGFLLNNLTAPPDQAPFVIYIFPWLAGLTVTRVVTSRQRLGRPVAMRHMAQ